MNAVGGTVEALCPFVTVGIGILCNILQQCLFADFSGSARFGLLCGLGTFPIDDGGKGDVELLGNFPEAGTELELPGCTVRVLDFADGIVASAEIQRHPPEDETEEED